MASLWATHEKGKIARYGRDDLTYIARPELMDLIPRGCSDFVWPDGTKTEMRGMRKFDGTTNVDDDGMEDVEESKSMLPLQRITEWGDDRLITCQEKANGKMAIFMLVEKDGVKYIYGGSKNVHVMHKLNEPIVINEKNDHLHWHILKAIQKDVLNKEMNVTVPFDKVILGEYVDGQHIVYVKEPFMVYFSTMNPRPMDLIPSQNDFLTGDQLSYIRTLTNTEGCVITYSNVKTGEVHRQKHKSTWYIIIRMIREALCKQYQAPYSNQMEEKLFSRCVQRLKKRSNDFLNLTPDEIVQWTGTIRKFVRFVLLSSFHLADLSFQSPIGMATVWHEFIGHDPATLKEPVIESMVKLTLDDLLQEPYLLKYVDALLKGGCKVGLILRGVSGSGKSTASKLLNAKYADSSVHSTDNFFSVDGVYTFNPALLSVNHEKNINEYEASYSQIAIVDNTNLEQWEYAKYRNADRVLVVLNMKAHHPSVLASRTTHDVPLKKIRQMCTKFAKKVHPLYYGVFFPRSKVTAIAKAIQKSPMHITYDFYGGKKKAAVEFTNLIGVPCAFVVASEHTSEHDCCLLGNLIGLPTYDYENRPRPHITLSVIDGHYASQVGEAATKTPEKKVDVPLTSINGVFGPSY